MNEIIKTVGDREIIKVKGNPGNKYVLAYLPAKDEWVSWISDDAVENFSIGHYFRNRVDAEKDFLNRGV